MMFGIGNTHIIPIEEVGETDAAAQPNPFHSVVYILFNICMYTSS